jgi:hypothetical protein
MTAVARLLLQIDEQEHTPPSASRDDGPSLSDMPIEQLLDRWQVMLDRARELYAASLRDAALPPLALPSPNERAARTIEVGHANLQSAPMPVPEPPAPPGTTIAAASAERPCIQDADALTTVRNEAEPTPVITLNYRGKGRTITERDVLDTLELFGDERVAAFKSGAMSKREAYELTQQHIEFSLRIGGVWP